MRLLTALGILAFSTSPVGCATDIGEQAQASEGARGGKTLFERETFGGNGRTCRTCHGKPTGTVSPDDAQARFAADPGDGHPSWSNDGSLLYHFSFRDGAFCPWVQRLDPATKRPIGPPRPVLHLHNPRLRAATGAAAANDARAGYLYLTATEATGNIWMLDERHD